MARGTKAKLAKLPERQRLALEIGKVLDREFPDAKCALHHETPEQLLFATILSAQCTDERVNKTTPALFRRFPGAKELARARVEEVEKLVKSVNFFRTKAKNLVAAAQMIQGEFGGELPRSIDELVRLPGVGRKTANVVLGDAFNLPVGVVVDTHVKRLVNLIGLVEGDDPVEIERELMQVVAKEHWVKFAHWLILHGRRTCVARRPQCAECPILRYCAYGRVAAKGAAREV